jgi:hypothetical protein
MISVTINIKLIIKIVKPIIIIKIPIKMKLTSMKLLIINK